MNYIMKDVNQIPVEDNDLDEETLLQQLQDITACLMMFFIQARPLLAKT